MDLPKEEGNTFSAAGDNISGESPATMAEKQSDPAPAKTADVGTTLGGLEATVRRQLLRLLRDSERRLGAATAAEPEAVRRRVRCLRYMQLGHAYLRAAYNKDVFQLERKFQQLLQPLLERRRLLVSGLVEPSAEEGAGDVAEEHDADESSKVKGIPGFWLQALRNSLTVGPLITERDAEVLLHLVDVRVVMADQQSAGFRLEFHFGPNDFLSDSVLSKEFDVTFDPDPTNPLRHGGLRVVSMRASGVHWKTPEADVTRDPRTGAACRSCFHFFSSDAPVAATDEEPEEAWERDVEVGLHLQRSLVPRAVLFYTGEAAQTDDSSSELDSDSSTSTGSYWG